MRHELVFVSQAREVKADHFVGPKRWLLPCPQRNQHAGDDRAVRLNLDAILILAQQVPAAQGLFEKTEEDFDRPPLRKNQTNHVRWYVQQIGRDAEDAVAIDTTGTAAILATRGVRVDANANDSHWMIEIGSLGKLHDLIADDFIETHVVVAAILLHDRPDTVITQAADVTASEFRDRVRVTGAVQIQIINLYVAARKTIFQITNRVIDTCRRSAAGRPGC